MITPRLRPRLEMEAPLAPGALSARVNARLREPECPCLGLATEQQIDLRIRRADRHFWSPQLTVIVRPHGGGSALIGHFGPNANVWTMILAVYGFITLGAITALFYGLSQLMVREVPWALWLLPISAVLILLIYAAAGVGQRLGRDQVDVLQSFIERAIGEAPDERSERDPAA